MKVYFVCVNKDRVIAVTALAAVAYHLYMVLSRDGLKVTVQEKEI